MSINFDEHVLGVGPNGELPPVALDQVKFASAGLVQVEPGLYTINATTLNITESATPGLYTIGA